MLLPLSWVLVTTSLAAARAGHPPVEPPRGPITEIQILRERVFEVDRGPVATIARIGNLLHIDTREGVIRDILLFREGDAVTPALAQEAERVLRDSGLFASAHIALDSRNDSTTVRVTTRDLWSTQLIARYKADGGVAEVALGAVENNFLGGGDAMSGIYRWSEDEDVYTIGFSKRRFLGSYSQASMGYAESSESVGRSLAFVQPYYSDLATWNGALSGNTFDGNVSLYVDGEKSGKYRTNWDYSAAYYVRHGGERPRWRLGGALSLDDRRSRPLSGDAITIATGRTLRNDRRRQLSMVVGLLHRSYVLVRNIDRSGEPEDLALGGACSLVLGSELESLGSTHDRPYVSLWARGVWKLTRAEYAILQLGGASHWRNFAPSGREASATLKAFSQRWQGQTQAVRLVVHGANRLFPEELLYLGAPEGLRGFHYRAFRGTTAALANLEQRIEPGLPLLGLMLGAVLFADAGYVWEDAVPIRGKDIRTDVGVGFRVRSKSLLPAPVRFDIAHGLGPDGDWQLSAGLGQVFRLVQRAEYPAPLPFRFGTSIE